MSTSGGPLGATWGERAGQPAHCSVFRRAIAARAASAGLVVGGSHDLVHEYLVEQANLRGYLGAYSARPPSTSVDPELGVEDIVAGLLQPHAPAEVRILKLVVRILQRGDHDARRLLLACRRERALDTLAWLVDQVPASERTPPLLELERELRVRPPRSPRAPRVRFDPRRLVRRPASP